MGSESPTESTARLRELEDRVEIEEVVNRYGTGIRENDPELIASCFTDDAIFNQGEGRSLNGREAIIRFYLNKASSSVSPASTFTSWTSSTPFISNVVVELEGDTAHCRSMCLAIHAGFRDEEGAVIVRGTENIDKFVRTASGWKISERTHSVMWGFEEAGTPFAKAGDRK